MFCINNGFVCYVKASGAITSSINATKIIKNLAIYENTLIHLKLKDNTIVAKVLRTDISDIHSMNEITVLQINDQYYIYSRYNTDYIVPVDINPVYVIPQRDENVLLTTFNSDPIYYNHTNQTITSESELSEFKVKRFNEFHIISFLLPSIFGRTIYMFMFNELNNRVYSFTERHNEFSLITINDIVSIGDFYEIQTPKYYMYLSSYNIDSCVLSKTKMNIFYDLALDASWNYGKKVV